MSKKIFSLIVLGFVLIVIAACSTEDPTPDPVEQDPAPEIRPEEEEETLVNIPQTAINADDFDVLVEALVTADLVGALEADGPFTPIKHS